MVGSLVNYNSRNILRYALGSTIAAAIAMGFNWPLSYLLPVLSLSFLASGQPAPKFRAGIMFFLIISFSSFFGLLLAKLFLPFPGIHILMLCLILFYIFYIKHPLFNPLLKTFLLISILLIPNMALYSKEVSLLIAVSMGVNAGLAILVIWFIFLLIPVQQAHELVGSTTSETLTKPTKIQQFNSAITSTLVILPVLLLFYFYNFTNSLLILIFISILSMQPGFAKDFKGGKALIIGNLIGGLTAILAYEVFTVVPEYFYLILIVLLVGLIFGRQVFSGKPMAALWGMGYSTFLLIIGSTTAMGTNEADAKVWTRVLQIMIAVIYIVTAFGLIERFKKEKKSEEA